MRLGIIAVLFLLVSCSSGAQTGKELSTDQFEKDLQQGGVQLLDVRTASEYRNGHIKNALQANWNDEKEFADRTTSLDKQKPVYVYCLSGPRSSAAAQWLRAKGYQVLELK
jgi:rhodanese-related sulfurtransferase